MEELSPQQAAELLQLIQATCSELEALLENSSESSKPVDLTQPIGRLSRMDAMQQQQMAIASRAAQRQRLKMLRHAEHAIGRNDYGFCRSCEEPIGFQRLKVRPESLYCLACQSQSERSH